jgi:hypothetical protein
MNTMILLSAMILGQGELPGWDEWAPQPGEEFGVCRGPG